VLPLPNKQRLAPKAVLSHVEDPDARVRLKALIALQKLPSPMPRPPRQFVKSLSNAERSVRLESAFMGVAAQNPAQFIEAAFDSARPLILLIWSRIFRAQIGTNRMLPVAGQLVILISSNPTPLTCSNWRSWISIARTLRPETRPNGHRNCVRPFVRYSLIQSRTSGTRVAARRPVGQRQWDGFGN